MIKILNIMSMNKYGIKINLNITKRTIHYKQYNKGEL